MQRHRAVHTGPAFDIKEELYRCGAALLRPVMVMISDSHPPEKRDEKLFNGMPNPEHDPEVTQEYNARYQRARKLLSRARNRANDEILVRYDIFRGEGGDEKAEGELRGALVDGCLDQLYENLVAWAPVLVAEQYVKPLQETLRRVLNGNEDTVGQKQRLTNFIKRFHATYRTGVLPYDVIYELEEIQYHIPPVKHIPEGPEF